MRTARRHQIHLLATRVAPILALLACEEYLVAPGESDEVAPPVLAGAVLTPDSVDVVEADAVVQASVRGRSSSGIDSVRIVLASPSGAERVRCLAREAVDGDAFDGEWQCPLDIPTGVEPGAWAADSLGIFSTDDPAGSRVWTGVDLAAVGVVSVVEVVSIPPVPATLTVEPELVVLTGADQTVTLVATVRSVSGAVIPNVPVIWSSAQEDVATVDDAGVVTPLSVGTAEIVAQADTLEARATVEVPSTPTTLEVQPAMLTFDEVGQSQALTVDVLNQFGDTIPDAEIEFETGDPEVVGVTDDGVVSATGSGSTVVRVRAGPAEREIPVVVGEAQLTPGHRWTNPSGGSFSDPANWSRGTVPSVGDTAIVDLEGAYAITMNSAATVAVLEVGGAGARPALRVEDALFEVQDTAHFAPGARLEIVFGNLTGDGTVVVEDTLIWSGGAQTGDGRTVVTASGTLLMDGEEKVADFREVVLLGSGTWTGGKVSLGNGGTLAVSEGAELRLAVADTIAWLSGPNGRGYLRVDGRLSVAAGAGVTTVTAGFVNDGEVHIEPGNTLETGGSGGTEGSGDWLIDLDAVMLIGGNSALVRFGPGSSVRGAGTLRIVSSVVGVQGTFDMDGRVEVVGNSLSLQSPPDTVRVNALHMLGGPVFVSGGVIQVRDEFVWESGPVINDGALHIIQGATAELSAANDRSVDTQAQLVVDGYLHWSGGGFLLRNGGDLVVGPTGVFEIDGAFSIGSVNVLSPDREPTIVNEGELLRSSGFGTSFIRPDFTNRGVLTIGAWGVAPTADFVHEAGAVVRGGGVLDVSEATSVRLDGVFAPGSYPVPASGGPNAGRLVVEEDLMLEASSRIEIEVGGTTTASHDVLEVAGLLNAAGELRISGFDGYLPAVGDTLEIVRFTEDFGAFDQVTGLDFGVASGGAALDTVWMADRLLLVGRSGAVGTAPTVVITAPADGSIHPEDEPITFAASAADEEDGDLSSSTVWSSDVDGMLGTGATVTTTLSPGPHLVSAAVTDSDGRTTSASIGVTVSTVTSGALYGVDSSTDALHTIDVETGTSVRIGTTLGGFDSPVAMAIVPSTEELLVWSNSPSRALVSVNACSGSGSTLQTYSSVAGSVGAIAYRADGALFGFNDGGMFRIDMTSTGRPLTTVTAELGVRLAGADFTPTNRLFGIELSITAPIRLVEIDPATGAVLQSFSVTDETGEPFNPGVAGSLTWNPSTGRFLATSIRGYPDVGRALYDLTLDGVASNPRAISGGGHQGMGFRSLATCPG